MSAGDSQAIVVSDPGVAVLAALRWLADGRSNLRTAALQGSGADPSPPPVGGVNTVLTLAITAPPGGAASSGAVLQAVQGALLGLLQGLRVPALITVEEQVGIPSDVSLAQDLGASTGFGSCLKASSCQCKDSYFHRAYLGFFYLLLEARLPRGGASLFPVPFARIPHVTEVWSLRRRLVPSSVYRSHTSFKI